MLRYRNAAENALSLPADSNLLTQVIGLQGRSYTIEKMRTIFRLYGRKPRPGSKTEIAWQLKQLEIELGLIRTDRLTILAGIAPPPLHSSATHGAKTWSCGAEYEPMEYIDLDGYAEIAELMRQRPTHAPASQQQQVQPALQRPPRSRIQPTETFQICLTDFGRLHFPKRRLTSNCAHEPCICLECLEKYLQHAVSNIHGDNFSCPLCPSPLSHFDIEEHASPEVFDRYDHLATLATLSSLPDFRFCFNPACNSGQLHTVYKRDPLGNLMTCDNCRSRSCFAHQIPWHEGMTCHEYDTDLDARAQREKRRPQLRDISTLVRSFAQTGTAV